MSSHLVNLPYPRVIEVTMAIPVDAGRPGDIWRLHAADRPVRVVKRDRFKIAFKETPDGRTRGIGKWDWDNTLERFREDLEMIFAGDTAHIYVAPTDIYILGIDESTRKPSGKGWFAWKTGEPPTPEIQDSGLFFDPSVDWNLDGERLYRPFSMLQDGERVIDSNGQSWVFAAPFWFADEEGQRGSPVWPLTIEDDEGRTNELNRTSENHEKTQWAARSGVGPEVFDLEWPTW